MVSQPSPKLTLDEGNSELAQALCGPLCNRISVLSASVASASESATAASEQAAASTRIMIMISTNASVISTAGQPTPSVFNGRASRVSEQGYGVAVVLGCEQSEHCS